jgi:hypothetical protein
MSTGLEPNTQCKGADLLFRKSALMWRVRCACGIEFNRRERAILATRVLDCEECARRRRDQVLRRAAHNAHRPKTITLAVGLDLRGSVLLGPEDGNRHRWRVRCNCGAEFTRSDGLLRRRMQARCDGCRKIEWDKARAASPRPAKRCELCEGMGHRRSPSGCQRCGEPFVPETLESLTGWERSEEIAGSRL